LPTSHDLLDNLTLEQSPTVANSAMNRERGLAGVNSYAKELGLDPLDFLKSRVSEKAHVCWLDLCCGRGRALIEAAECCESEQLGARVTLVGIDLVAMFDPHPATQTFLRLQEASVLSWEPAGRFDLITCVHGLHYIGDKLGLLQRVAGWLEEDGTFLAHLDFQNLKLTSGQPARRVLLKELRRHGFEYQDRRHLLVCRGHQEFRLPYRYLGADDRAGPNVTGQDAVNSWYTESEDAAL
jgi:SAM-dependent methyltransferase